MDLCRLFTTPDLRQWYRHRAIEGVHTQLEETHAVFEAARRIHEARENLATVRLFFLTDGVVGTRAAEVEEEQLPGLELRYVMWDLEKLSRLRVGQREIIELDFVKQYGGAIPCIAVQVKLSVLTDPAKVTEIVPLISKYANSQNRVTARTSRPMGSFITNWKSFREPSGLCHKAALRAARTGITSGRAGRTSTTRRVMEHRRA